MLHFQFLNRYSLFKISLGTGRTISQRCLVLQELGECSFKIQPILRFGHIEITFSLFQGKIGFSLFPLENCDADWRRRMKKHVYSLLGAGLPNYGIIGFLVEADVDVSAVYVKENQDGHERCLWCIWPASKANRQCPSYHTHNFISKVQEWKEAHIIALSSLFPFSMPAGTQAVTSLFHQLLVS